MFSFFSVLLFFSFSLSIFDRVLGLEFQYPNFNNTQNLSIVTQNWYSAGPDAKFQDSQLWLTQLYNVSNDASNLGRVTYAAPIDFSAVSYFQTSFTFKIITTQPYGKCGSGMAFFISPSAQAPNHSDNSGALGLVDPDSSANANFFAVEFDTRLSSKWNDPSSSHMGINVNSMASVSLADSSPSSTFYPELYLYNNYTFTVWIEYNCSSSCDVQVWMTNNTASPSRPTQPCMNLTYNLASIFNTPVYLGFSATSAPSEQGAEAHIIYSWNVTIVSSVNHNNRNLVLIVVPVVTVVVFLVVTCGFLIWYRCNKRNRAYRRPNLVQLNERNNSPNIQLALMSVPRYSFPEIKKATHGFGDKFRIGEGGFSIVYKGILSDGSLIAVKKLKEGLRKEAEFCREVNIISKIRHRNLLELQGWCYEKGEAMLIYKHMANGSLDKHLFGNKKGTLNRQRRFRILAGIAASLEYLHNGLGDCILHRDVKASNVLLTDEFEPMLSDFGLARLISHDQVVSITHAGTPGYVAPELVYTGRATDKADVYSFGVLALELACGRKSTDESLQNVQMLLIDWVWLLHQSKNITEALDPSIKDDMSHQEEHQWRCVLHVALMCYNPIPDDRPSMRQVTQALNDESLLPLPDIRPQHPYTSQTTRPAISSSAKSHMQFSSPMSRGSSSLPSGKTSSSNTTSEFSDSFSVLTPR